MSLITQLSSDFSRAVRSRGSDYFQEGRVKITDGSDWDVLARVRGSRIYRVELSIEENDLVVYCDCPHFEREPCKHLWATILAVEGKGYLRGDGSLGPLAMVPGFDDNSFFGDGDENDFYDGDDEDWPGGDDDDDDQPRQNAVNRLRDGRSKEKLPSWKEQLATLGRVARAEVAGSGEKWSPTRRVIYSVDVQATLESQHLI